MSFAPLRFSSLAALLALSSTAHGQAASSPKADAPLAVNYVAATERIHTAGQPDATTLATLGERAAAAGKPYAIGLPRGDWQMRLAVNSALAQLYRGGVIREIFGRWFGSIGRPGPVMEAAFLFGALPE